MMKKNKTVKTGIIIAILLLTVGFAAVTTQLFINGVITLKPDSSNFKKYVVFADDSGYEPKITVNDQFNLAANSNDMGSAEVTDEGKTIIFTTPIFYQIGDEVTLHYHIKNKSQYHARLGEVSCEVYNEDGSEIAESENKYLNVVADNKIANKRLDSDSISDEDTLRIIMTRSFAGTSTSETKKYQVRCEMTPTGEKIKKNDSTNE